MKYSGVRLITNIRSYFNLKIKFSLPLNLPGGGNKCVIDGGSVIPNLDNEYVSSLYIRDKYKDVLKIDAEHREFIKDIFNNHYVRADMIGRRLLLKY